MECAVLKTLLAGNKPNMAIANANVQVNKSTNMVAKQHHQVLSRQNFTPVPTISSKRPKGQALVQNLTMLEK